MYTHVCVYAHECSCPQKLEALDTPGAGVTGSHELPYMGTGN